jgi:MFS family permease
VSNLDLALFTGLGTAQTFTRGTLTVFTVVVALDLLHTGEPGVGTLTGAIGAGAVIGSLIASLLVGSRWLAQWFGIGVALWGLPIALIPLFPQQAAALTLLACVGIGNALVDVGLFTLMARLAPDEILARVFGLFESLITLAVGLGALVASLLIEWTSVAVALVFVGALCPSLVVVAWPRLRHLDRDIGSWTPKSGCFTACPCSSRCHCRRSSSWLVAWSRSMCLLARPCFRQGDPAVLRHRGGRGGCGRRQSRGDEARPRRWVWRDCAAAQGAAYSHSSGGQRPGVAGADLQPLPAGRHRIPRRARGRRGQRSRRCSTGSVRVNIPTIKTGRDTSAEIH